MSSDPATASIAHGGNLAEARRRFPGAPTPLIDLSTGINPNAYPFSPLRPAAFTRLPEPADIEALQAIAARAYGVSDPAMVVAAPGTQILINLLPRLFPQTRITILGPTYAEHAACWAASGTAVIDARDPAELQSATAAVVCNPNNPDGRIVPSADLASLAAHLDLLVVDEAFADLEGPGISLAPHLARPNTIILRSFGKTYGLAGIRLGFALATPPIAAILRAALGPWAISGPALQIASEALPDTAWLARASDLLQSDAARLDGLLRNAGCTVVGGTRLFRLVTTGDTHLYDRLGRAGIVVRAFADWPGRLRFGVPRGDEWERVEAALEPSL